MLEIPKEPRHVVVVCGAAVAGSEAAAFSAERGVLTIVLEQNVRPYGKIEDGLPRWHVALRKQEYQRIDENLSKPGIVFVPSTRIGRDLDFAELANGWGASAVVLAHGAWRDRPLGIEAFDQYIDRGLVYQNPFVYWYNHYPEKAYDGPRYEVVDDAIVVGGGLASIDVVKIINLELYERALRARGIETDMHELERQGIGKVLEKHKITQQELGVHGCTLFYRRRKRDMPLASPPDNATPEQLKKTETVREKVMDVCMRKYLVRFEEGHLPIAPLVEGDRMVGVRFRRTEIQGGKVVELPGTERDVRGPLTISSIGSIPEILPGIPMKSELYQWKSWDTGELAQYPGVYGLGNVLTGKGNIKVSRDNAREIMEQMLGAYLGVRHDAESIAILSSETHEAVRESAAPILDRVQSQPKLEPSQIAAILERVRACWSRAGYDGDYRAWIARVTPPDLQ